MPDPLSNAEKQAFYKSHRERTAVVFKKKHDTQYNREFANLTDANPTMSVLEIGCGTGLFLRYLEAHDYAEIVGVDMDENLQDALRDLRRSEIHLDDVMGVLRGTLAHRTFDRIVLLDVAEHLHLPDLTALLTLLKKHLKADGRLLLRVPNIESPWGQKMFYGTFDHVTPLGPGRLTELALKTGWICEGCYAQEPVPFFRRLKERLFNKMFECFLTYHPSIWTANVLAVYKAAPD